MIYITHIIYITYITYMIYITYITYMTYVTYGKINCFEVYEKAHKTFFIVFFPIYINVNSILSKKQGSKKALKDGSWKVSESF